MDIMQTRKNFKSPPDAFKYGQKPSKIQFDRPYINKDNLLKSINDNPFKKLNAEYFTSINSNNRQQAKRVSIDKFQFSYQTSSGKKMKSSSLNKRANDSFKPLRTFATQKKVHEEEAKFTSPNRTEKSKSQFPLLRIESSKTRLLFTTKTSISDLSAANFNKKQNPERQGSVEKQKLFFKKQKYCNSPTIIPKVTIRKVTNEESSFKLALFEQRKQPAKIQTTKPPTLDDFQIGKSLGKGYFGQVFMVKHKKINFICAMKVISRELIKREQTSNQLLRQLKICSYTNHCNIVQFYGCFANQQNIYILQELMTGDEVYKILKKMRKFDEEQTAYMIAQVLQSLDYLHNNFITHRDIKPENILMNHGVAKLCDFGWAVYDPQDHRTSSIGTLLYLSPENVKGDGYDRRNDIWGIGILTYEMLIGNVPFNLWAQDQKHKIIKEEVKFPFYMQISDIAKDFIMKMLEKDPNDRYTIKQLQEHPFLAKVNLMESAPIL